MSHTLLLADDSVTTHRVLELIFAGQDLRVVAIADGEQAVELMRTMRPDIVLADVTLPRFDGYQLAEHVRRTPALAGVPVLLLSGAFDVVDEPRVRAAGAVGLFVKPLEPEAVIKRVKELLGISPKDDSPAPSGRLITPAEPPHGPPPEPSGVDHPRVSPPPRQAHIPVPRAAWDELREQRGFAPDTANLDTTTSSDDDYRDKLDETFDSLDKQLSGSSVRSPAARRAPTGTPSPLSPPIDATVEPPVFEVDSDWFGETSPDAPAERSTLVEATTPDASTSARSDAHASLGGPSAPVASAAARAEPLAGGGEPSPKRVEVRAGGPDAPVAPVQVADAFESLLAAEQGTPPPRPATAAGVSDAVVDRIATRVAERLSEGVFIDIVTQIVTAVAERLVREEIARIRAKVEERKD